MRRLLPWLLPLALAAHLAFVAVWTTGLTALYALQVYRAGGARLLDGLPIYDGFAFWVLYFTYPPFAAVAFTPLSLVPVDVLKVAFSLLNVAALAAVIWLSLRALGYRSSRNLATATVGLTGLLFWLEPVRSTIGIGQVNLMLMLLVLADVLRPTRFQGAGIGIAAGIKLVPGVFILYLLLTRRWRAAATAGVTFAVTVGAGFLVAPRDSVRYWTGTFVTTGRIGKPAETGNQSLSGMLARLGAPDALWPGLALLLGVAGMALAVRAYHRGGELLGVTVCGLTACVVSPFTWNHHWVWFVPLLLWLAHAARAGRVATPVPVLLYLVLLDWPVTLPPRDWIFPPRTGLINLDTPVTRNLYVLLAIVVFLALWLRPAHAAAAAGDLGEDHAGGDRGVERLHAGGHGDRDGLVTGLADEPGQAASLGADHHDER
jgi:alpha-1,2-mannosyltransferase